jgi:hypothetical protein
MLVRGSLKRAPGGIVRVKTVKIYGLTNLKLNQI